MFVRSITSKWLNIGWSNLAVKCIVQKSRPSLKVKVKGQRSRSPGTKKRKTAESSPLTMHMYKGLIILVYFACRSRCITAVVPHFFLSSGSAAYCWMSTHNWIFTYWLLDLWRHRKFQLKSLVWNTVFERKWICEIIGVLKGTLSNAYEVEVVDGDIMDVSCLVLMLWTTSVRHISTYYWIDFLQWFLYNTYVVLDVDDLHLKYSSGLIGKDQLSSEVCTLPLLASADILTF